MGCQETGSHSCRRFGHRWTPGRERTSPCSGSSGPDQEQRARRTRTFTTYCSAVSLYSWCPMVKLMWGKLDSLLQSTRNCMQHAGWHVIDLPFFKYCSLHSSFLPLLMVNLLQRSIRPTHGPALPQVPHWVIAAAPKPPGPLKSIACPNGTKCRAILMPHMYKTKFVPHK